MRQLAAGLPDPLLSRHFTNDADDAQRLTQKLARREAGPQAATQPVQRNASDAGNAANVYFPNLGRQGRAGGKRRGVLLGFAQGGSTGGDAHLPKWPTRRRVGENYPRNEGMAR